MRRVRRFEAAVEYLDRNGLAREESFPLLAADYSTAKSMALSYVVKVLRLENFELRLAGA